MKTDLLFFALCALLFAGCDEVAEPNDNSDASSTDTDADCDGGQGDCGAPWGWYDETSGLCWEVPPSDTVMTWDEAVDYCDELVSGGHCDWRLSSISELRSVMRGCEATMTGGACGVTDECTGEPECYDIVACCPNCYLEGPGPGGCLWDSEITGDCVGTLGEGGPFFWSSTAIGDSHVYWQIVFKDGCIGFEEGDASCARPWCVRTGL